MRFYGMTRWLLAGLFILVFCVSAYAAEPARPLKAGMIGLDTSHVIAFVNVLNDPNKTGDLAEVKVVAGYPGGSPDVAASAGRVDMFTEKLRARGIEIVGSIDELLKKVDVVLLESVDGRPHLEQVKPVLAARKPVFVDKPCAGSLADVIEIFRLAKEHNCPCFSSSSLRFGPEVLAMRTDPPVGEVRGANAYGPCSLEEHHPDFFWYGVHGVEILFTIMGTGCQSVSRVQTEGTDVAVGTWQDGRIGTFRGIREGKRGYGATVFGTKSIATVGRSGGYETMVVEICKFFKTGKPPVSAEETIEIFAFMEAADESKRQGGHPVTIQSVIEKAQKANAAKAAAEKK